MKTFDENNKEEVEKYMEAFKSFKGKVSPMNTESCRKHMEKILNKDIDPTDVLWCIYHN